MVCVLFPNFPNSTILVQSRWCETILVIPCVQVLQNTEQDYIWRRIQVSQQQAERQKKSVLQLCMTFHRRAEKILQVSCLNRLRLNVLGKPFAVVVSAFQIHRTIFSNDQQNNSPNSVATLGGSYSED